MVNLCNLVTKYSHFSKVHDDVFVYIDRILENAYEIHTKQLKAKSDIDSLHRQLEEDRKKKINSHENNPTKTSAKKRRVRSVDTSLSEQKENISILEDSRFFPYKSDPETSSLAASVLEQNILDSEESFFAITQSPPRKEVLSPINASESQQLPVATVKPNFTSVSKPAGNILRASRLSRDFSSPDRSTRVRQQNTTGFSTPKAVPGKWTTTKQIAGSAGTPRREHTPSAVKRFHSLMDGTNRLRQTKLKFPETDNTQMKRKEAEPPANDDTLFSDFIVPTPPSVANKSKLLRSLRMKKQSTMVDSAGQDRPICKASSMVTIARRKENIAANIHPESHDDDYDIDQTFCPGAESFNRLDGEIAVKFKQEPKTQHNPPRTLSAPPRAVEPVAHLFDDNSEDADSPGVVIVPSKEETIISIAESQPVESNLFMPVLHGVREKCNEEESFGQAILSTKMKRNDKQGISPMMGSKVKPQGTTNGRMPHDLCSNCSKLYHFHTSCGVSDDTARSKLPRNCRSCRLAQLHSTPPGFWNPDFLPTQQ
uniref:Uncharacterized protein n=1 Tax=Anopheles atroparvus TaxID=41427 RepID=A0AAG5D438_ANOAO